MLDRINFERVVCLDIETVPQFEHYKNCPDELKDLWKKKAALLRKPEADGIDTSLYERAGIYAEFGKVICISIGMYSVKQNHRRFQLESFYNDDEKNLLNEFKNFLEELHPESILCAHNGKEFDFPYLCRRMIIHSIQLPDILNNYGKKPWEIQHLDTLELWKFGDYKNYTPLNLLAYILGIESPKNDINGSMVADVYYKENDLLRIVEYCEKDVLTVMQIILRLRQESILSNDEVFSTLNRVAL